MVDSRDLLLYMIIISHAELIQQRRRADLDTVAQSYRFYFRHTEHRAGQHRHGIRIVEQPRFRTDLLHVPGKVQHHRNRPQRAEYAADAQGIRDRLLQTVFFRNLKICDCAGIITSYLYGIDHIVCPAQRVLSLRHAQILADAGFRPVVSVDCLQHGFRFIQPDRINIIKCDLTRLQYRRHHTVTKNVLGKHG